MNIQFLRELIARMIRGSGTPIILLWLTHES